MTDILVSPRRPRLDPRPVAHRIGLVALSTDHTTEVDFARILGLAGIGVYVNRIANPVTPETLRAMEGDLAEGAALILPGEALDAIVYGCTSASAVLGQGVQKALGGRAPVSTPTSGALRGFAALGVTRVALMTPYLPQTADLVGDHFAAHGLEVVSRRSMGRADDRDMALLPEAEVMAFALAADHPDAQALFMSCTALPALGLIDRIEARLGKPVISANQALFWAMLDQARIPASGPGRLFQVRTW